MSAVLWDVYPKDIFRWVSFGNGLTPPVPPVTDGGGGRIRHIGDFSQSRVESETEKLARRIREGTIPAPVDPVSARPPADLTRYAADSARLAKGIEKARGEVLQFRAEIDRLEQAQAKRQNAKAQRELLLAQQAYQLAKVKEAVFLEEMEVLDVAYVVQAALRVVLQ